MATTTTTQKTVRVVITGDSTGVQQALGQADAKAATVSGTIKSSISAIGAALNKGGLVSPFSSALEAVGGIFDSLKEKSESLAEKVSTIGAGVAGAGGVLMVASSGQVQALSQLKQSITDTGGSYDDYSDQIDKVVKQQLNVGNSAENTYGALQTLTSGTGSTTKALSLMTTAADLAASKHESLNTAATQLAKVVQGNGSKVLAQYGITLSATGYSAANLTAAHKALTAATTADNNAVNTANNDQQKVIDTLTLLGAAHKATAAQISKTTDAWSTLDQDVPNTPKYAADQIIYNKSLADMVGPAGLSASQTIQLRNANDNYQAAQYKVTQTGVAYTAAQKQLATEQADVTSKTKTGQQAVTELGQKLAGQASASVSGFTGQLRVLGVKIEDQVATIGQRYGPAITGIGVGITAAGSAVNLASSIMGHFKDTTDAAKDSTEALTDSERVAKDAAEAQAIADGEVDTSLLPVILTVGLIVAAIALLAIGIYELVTHWSAVFGAIKAVVADAWHFIDGNFIQPVMGAFSAVVDFIRDHWQLILAIITGPIGLAVLAIKDNFNSIINFISGVPGTILNFFSALPGQFVTLGWNLVVGIARGISSGVGQIAHALDDILHSAVSSIPVLGGVLSHIPGLASGGIVTSPTLAVIGEAGPEAVVPLSGLSNVANNGILPLGSYTGAQNGSAAYEAAKGAGQVINFQQVNYTQADPTEIANEVTWNLSRLAS